MADGGRSTRGADPHAPFGFVYLLTIIGAAVYFVGEADGFWGVVLALLKALVWPAFVAYRALQLMSI